jgi:hypothetical protein
MGELGLELDPLVLVLRLGWGRGGTAGPRNSNGDRVYVRNGEEVTSVSFVGSALFGRTQTCVGVSGVESRVLEG